MKPYAEKFYTSRAWRDCRKAYFTMQHGICERCQGAGKIVHHKIYISPDNINDPSITLNFDNLELLCQDCHNKEHHGSDYDVVRDDVMFDSNGDLVEVREDG
jgi:5-methylcytosine-specific restriction endonuclease McrA